MTAIPGGRSALDALIAKWRARADGPVPTDRAIGIAECADDLSALLTAAGSQPVSYADLSVGVSRAGKSERQDATALEGDERGSEAAATDVSAVQTAGQLSPYSDLAGAADSRVSLLPSGVVTAAGSAPVTTKGQDDETQAASAPQGRPVQQERAASLLPDVPTVDSGQRVVEDIAFSLRSGFLFGNFDEPLNAYGLRIVRVILERLRAGSSVTAQAPAKHKTCGTVVETAVLNDDVAIYVWCPTCRDLVEDGELDCSSDGMRLFSGPQTSAPTEGEAADIHNARQRQQERSADASQPPTEELQAPEDHPAVCWKLCDPTFENAPHVHTPQGVFIVDIIDPKSERGQQIIRNSAFEKPLTQGDPPPSEFPRHEPFQPGAQVGSDIVRRCESCFGLAWVGLPCLICRESVPNLMDALKKGLKSK